MRRVRFNRWAAALCVALPVAMCAAPTAFAAPSECVILLHGLARTSYSMNKIEDVLRDEGFLVANINYPSRDFPIESLAESAVNAGLDACRKQSAESIHFVTHSMGGILVRYYLSHHDIPELGRVVMMGPPNRGSEAVDQFADVPGFLTLNGPAGAQLGTDPDSLPNRLGAVDFPVGVIAGTGSLNPILSATLPDQDDGKVTVESTRVDGMADFIAIAATHSYIMRNDEAIRQTLAFLQQGRFADDAPVDAEREEIPSAAHRD